MTLLSRALMGLAASSSPGKWSLLRPIALLQPQSSPVSTTAASKTPRTYKRKPKPSESEPEGGGGRGETLCTPPSRKDPAADLARPGEIPFQARVANSVRLVGTIAVRPELQSVTGGDYAVSVLASERTKDLPQFWIPIIFQGDLAQNAACHLKENDLVYITGQLSGDAPLHTVKDAQASIQVLVDTLSFVQNNSLEKESHIVHEQDDRASDSSAVTDENASNLHLWNDLLDNPHNWCDNRSGKNNQASATFEHKETGQLLTINDTTPAWVRARLDSLSLAPDVSKNEKVCSLEKLNIKDKPWRDLLDNPQSWQDNRANKQNGLLSPKFPDFRNPDTKKGLWLDSAPDWVLQELDGVVFNNMVKQQETIDARLAKRAEKENLWRNLVENPNKWWDNRSSKLKPNHPDFKHKETGEALWLSSSTPSWALEKFPEANSKQDVVHKEYSIGHAFLLQ